MKIALFGATGGVGLEFLRQSTDYPFDISAIDCQPEKLCGEFPYLKKIPASIYEYEVLREAVRGFDVVLSLVGVPVVSKVGEPNILYERVAENLIRLCRENKIPRLVVLTSGEAIEAKKDPWYFKYFLQSALRRSIYMDLLAMERMVRESGLNYTIVRSPFITCGKLTKDYRVIQDQWFTNGLDISGADLAHFLLECLKCEKTKYKTLGVSY